MPATIVAITSIARISSAVALDTRHRTGSRRRPPCPAPGGRGIRGGDLFNPPRAEVGGRSAPPEPSREGPRPSVDGVLGMQLHGGKDLLEPCSVVLSEEVPVVR